MNPDPVVYELTMKTVVHRKEQKRVPPNEV